jgi:WD40 repeat protein
MFRSMFAIAACLAAAACGSSGPERTTRGPLLDATLAATWPAEGPARGTAFSNDGRLLATSDASGKITIRDASGWRVAEQLQHPVGATAVAFSLDSSHVFSSGYDGSVREWDLARRALVRTVGSAHGTLWTLAIAPDGRHLAAAGEDAIIRVWDLNGREGPQQLRGHSRNIWTVHFSPDGNRLASGSFDDSVRLWDASTGKQLKQLNGHTAAIVGLAFSPDGKLIATGADDSTIRLWRASDGALVRRMDNGRHVDAVAFSPDGKWLVSGGHAHATLGDLWHQLGGSGEGDSVRLWRTSDGALVGALPHPDDVIALAFSPDGRWLVTSCEDDKFRLWRLAPRD